MNVESLCERIIDMSHEEDAPDTNLKDKCLQWLNHAYFELMDELSVFTADLSQKLETVKLVDGAGETLFEPHKILSVVHNQTRKRLTYTTLAELMQKQMRLDDNGTPAFFYINGTQICVQPKATTAVDVLYIPKPRALGMDDAEADILLPPQFHHSLIWGGLVWAAIYERSFVSQGDLTLFQAKWDEAKQKIKLSFAAAPGLYPRAKRIDFI